MTNTENVKAEMLRQADWLQGRAELALDQAEEASKEGDSAYAAELNDKSDTLARKARSIRAAAAL